MNIRKATLSDSKLILSLIRDLSRWLLIRNIYQWTNYPVEGLESEIESGEVFVYCEKEVIVGTITLTKNKNDFWDNAESTLYLHRLAIARACAGRGLGRKLMGWAELECNRRGVRTLRLDCDAENKVLRSYYASLGFKFLRVEYHKPYRMNFALFEKHV